MAESQDGENQFVTLDAIIPYIGEFQRFQWLLVALFCALTFPAAYPVLIMFFAAVNPDWRCVTNSSLCLSNETFPADNNSRCTLPREDWEFTEPKQFSIVTWFDIYCDNSWMIELSTSILFIGSGAGALLVGWVADNFGRKNVIFISSAAAMLCGLVAAFIPNIYVFVFLRFVIGVFLSGTSTQMCILLCEIVGSSYRPLAGLLVWIFSSVALCVLSLKAYLIRNWQILFVVCTVPYLFLLLFYKFSPESPRWLRIKGKSIELMQTLQRISRVNKTDMPSHLSILPVDNESEKQGSNLLRTFRSLKMVKIAIVLGYGFFAHGLVYYGIHMAASRFGSSFYLTFFLLSLVEVPGNIASIYICNKFGRKRPTITGVFIVGVSCIILAFLPTKMNTLRVIIGLLGKTVITITFNTICIWSIESVPTVVRGQFMGFTAFCVQLGSGASPWVSIKLGKLHYSTPYICMSVVALLCSVLCLLILETKGMPTLETLEDLDSHTATSKENQLLTRQEHA